MVKCDYCPGEREWRGEEGRYILFVDGHYLLPTLMSKGLVRFHCAIGNPGTEKDEKMFAGMFQ